MGWLLQGTGTNTSSNNVREDAKITKPPIWAALCFSSSTFELGYTFGTWKESQIPNFQTTTTEYMEKTDLPLVAVNQ